MEKFLSDNPSLKRILVTLIGVAVIAANKRFSLGLGEADVAAMSALVVGFLIQSGLKSAAQVKADAVAAGAKAADKVDSLEAAAKELGK